MDYKLICGCCGLVIAQSEQWAATCTINGSTPKLHWPLRKVPVAR